MKIKTHTHYEISSEELAKVLKIDGKLTNFTISSTLSHNKDDNSGTLIEFDCDE